MPPVSVGACLFSPSTFSEISHLSHPAHLYHLSSQHCSPTHTKRSIGGVSTNDSGVVSHDSLLEHCTRDNSASSDRRSSMASTQSSPARRSSRSEFDLFNRPAILDSKIRSHSRSRYVQYLDGRMIHAHCRSQSELPCLKKVIRKDCSMHGHF